MSPETRSSRRPESNLRLAYRADAPASERTGHGKDPGERGFCRGSAGHHTEPKGSRDSRSSALLLHVLQGARALVAADGAVRLSSPPSRARQIGALSTAEICLLIN